MGLSLSDLLILSEFTKGVPGPRVSFLGVPDISCSQAALRAALMSSEPDGDWQAFHRRSDAEPLSLIELTAWLGFPTIETLDVSDYEGATHRFDLNADHFSLDQLETSSLIVDAGTLEHVFNIPNALDQLRHKLIEGGVIIHLNPGNGFFEHGFWQISPTLYRNYYSSAGFSIEAMGFYQSSPSRGLLADITFLKPDKDLYRVDGGVRFAARLGRVTTFVVAKKISSTHGPVISVVQDFYTKLHTNGQGKYSDATTVNDAILKRQRIRWDLIYILSLVLQRVPTPRWFDPLQERLLTLLARLYAIIGLVGKIGFLPSVALTFRYIAESVRRDV
jgi:hypothetical protein